MPCYPVPLVPTYPVSDLSGVQETRLYENLKKNTMMQLLASQNVLTSIGIDGVLALSSFIDALSAAIAAEVLSEIKSHSRLESIARDTGKAGAGIIVGYVK